MHRQVKSNVRANGISLCSCILGKVQASPGMDQWKSVKKVMMYLLGTKNIMLTFNSRDDLCIIGYIDLDFVGFVDDLKSTTGYILILAGVLYPGKV